MAVQAEALSKAKVVCLPQLIEGCVQQQPKARAIFTKDSEWTYFELNERSESFATAILDAGLLPGTVVGIFMDRSPDLVAALLGVWKAGAAYLPLDPICPPERLAFELQDSGALFVIADRKYASVLPAHSVRFIYVDNIPAKRPHRRYTNFKTVLDSLAYVLYTSGSTGKPKGVEVCHEGLANVTVGLAEQLQLFPGEVLLAHSSFGFDISNLETYLPLVSGGSIYLSESGFVRDGEQYIRAINKSGATTMLGTPTMWQLLVSAGWEGKQDLRVLTGGESLPRELAKALVKRSGSVWNQYGPTEATIVSTTVRIDDETDKITIGQAIPNVYVKVLGSDLRPVKVGTTGEIYIGGVGVARGYRNRPDLTTASFLPDPFSADPSARLYKTGDLGRELTDGRLEFHGRVDSQVKIRGYRIELEEIEEHIRLYPGVDAAAVLLTDREQGGHRLVAWVAAKFEIPAASIREFLKKRVPAYMVPSEFRHIHAMPLNINGKADRAALRSNALEPVVSGEPSSSFADNDVESGLRRIWEELLHISSFDLTDSFFDLGGDSLLAALLTCEIDKKFGRKIDPDTLIECPTIKLLAAKLMREETTTGLSSVVPLRAEGSRPPLFIVHGLGGSSLLFRMLSTCLNEDQPVYCLKLPTGSVTDRNQVSIRVLASKYLAEIRSIYPSGLFHLGGHSFGGLIAFEMASQLAGNGESMGLLALLDSDRNIGRAGSQATEERQAPNMRLRRWKAKVESLVEKGLTEVIRRRLEYMKLQKRVRDAGRTPPDAISNRGFEADELLVLAAAAYHPGPYSGDAVVFRALDEVRTESDSALGWASLVRGKLELVEVPGKHLTAFDEPNVATLALKLEQKLNAAAPLELERLTPVLRPARSS